MERSKVNSILNINDPMPRNDFRKENKNKTPIKASYAKADTESSVLNCQKISHTKGHYGIEDPELRFNKKGRRTHI